MILKLTTGPGQLEVFQINEYNVEDSGYMEAFSESIAIRNDTKTLGYFKIVNGVQHHRRMPVCATQIEICSDADVRLYMRTYTHKKGLKK